MRKVKSRADGFGLLEAMVAAAVLAILVLGISKTNLGALLSRKTLNERRIFNERVSAASSALAILDSCTCIMGKAFRDNPGALNNFTRQNVNANPLTLNIPMIAYWDTPDFNAAQMTPNCGADPDLATATQADIPKFIFVPGRSIQNPISNLAGAQAPGQVRLEANPPGGAGGLQLRNIKYGGQVLNGANQTNCSIYIGDIWISGRRIQKDTPAGNTQAGMTASIPVSFVIRDNGAVGVEFKKCYSKSEWENYFSNPNPVACN